MIWQSMCAVLCIGNGIQGDMHTWAEDPQVKSAYQCCVFDLWEMFEGWKETCELTRSELGRRLLAVSTVSAVEARLTVTRVELSERNAATAVTTRTPRTNVSITVVNVCSSDRAISQLQQSVINCHLKRMSTSADFISTPTERWNVRNKITRKKTWIYFRQVHI